MSDHLPEDIMVRIFERLPTKSLIRFSCLSKRWNLLILSSPVFAKSHFQIASQQQTITRKFLFKADSNNEEKPGLECLDLEAAGGNNNSGSVSKKCHTPFINQSDDIIGFCSCNGLVCVLLKSSINKKTRLYIWNPSTGCNKELPCPNFDSEEEGFRRSITSFGIGYVSATDDYKVFIIIEIYGQHLEMDTWESNTLSLRTPNTWKRKPIEPPFNFNVFERKGTLLHETLHWANNDGIIAFDLCKEEFRTMPFPPQISATTHWWMILGASLGGCLCLMGAQHPFRMSAEFWVMREYYVADSWALQFTLSNLVPYKLLLATETSVYVETKTDWIEVCAPTLVRISGYDENKVQICVVGKEGHLDAIEYKETLQWLP